MSTWRFWAACLVFVVLGATLPSALFGQLSSTEHIPQGWYDNEHSNLAAAQTSQPVVLHACTPVSQRTGELGCWILSDEPIGALTRTQAFWHLDVYPTRAAAEAEKGPHSTVVEGLGKIWLMTIGEELWKPANGERVAKIGPLPFAPDNFCGIDLRPIRALH